MERDHHQGERAGEFDQVDGAYVAVGPAADPVEHGDPVAVEHAGGREPGAGRGLAVAADAAVAEHRAAPALGEFRALLLEVPALLGGQALPFGPASAPSGVARPDSPTTHVPPPVAS